MFQRADESPAVSKSRFHVLDFRAGRRKTLGGERSPATPSVTICPGDGTVVGFHRVPWNDAWWGVVSVLLGCSWDAPGVLLGLLIRVAVGVQLGVMFGVLLGCFWGALGVLSGCCRGCWCAVLIRRALHSVVRPPGVVGKCG